MRHGWLDALYEEAVLMHREGVWQKGSGPRYAHGMDSLGSTDGWMHEMYHINGNSLYDFKSTQFGQYMEVCNLLDGNLLTVMLCWMIIAHTRVCLDVYTTVVTAYTCCWLPHCTTLSLPFAQGTTFSTW